jgi:hypothetical protein
MLKALDTPDHQGSIGEITKEPGMSAAMLDFLYFKYSI